MIASDHAQRRSLTEWQPFLQLAYRPAGVPTTASDDVASMAMAPSFFNAARTPQPNTRSTQKKARSAWARSAAMIRAAMMMRGGGSNMSMEQVRASSAGYLLARMGTCLLGRVVACLRGCFRPCNL